MDAPEAVATGRFRHWAPLAWALGILGLGEALAILALLSIARPAVATIPADEWFFYVVVVLLLTISVYWSESAYLRSRLWSLWFSATGTRTPSNDSS